MSERERWEHLGALRERRERLIRRKERLWAELQELERKQEIARLIDPDRDATALALHALNRDTAAMGLVLAPYRETGRHRDLVGSRERG